MIECSTLLIMDLLPCRREELGASEGARYGIGIGGSSTTGAELEELRCLEDGSASASRELRDEEKASSGFWGFLSGIL